LRCRSIFLVLTVLPPPSHTNIMRFAIFSFVAAALCVQQAASIPFDKRDTSTGDTNILQFSLTLEHVEVAYYSHALQQLFSQSDFIKAGFTPLVFQRFVEIGQHEQTHVALLTAALGDQAPQACTYSFPITDVQSFVHLSQVIEDVGSSAYAGAIPLLTSQANVLTGASILGTEVRQAAWVSTSVNNGVPWGSSFQTSLTMNQAFSLANGFIVSCPTSNPTLGLAPFPALNITGAFPALTATPGENATVQFTSSVTATHIAFVFGLTPTFVPIQDGTVLVPANVSGQVYAIATSSGTDASDSSTVAGPAILLFEKFSNGSLTN